MVFDIIIGAVLLAFGIVAVYFTLEGDKEGSTFLMVLLIGLAAIVGGGWILITRITLAILLTKVAGLILALVGFFLVVQFPDIGDYQKEGMSMTGILIGMILLVLGVYLLFFA